MEKQKKPGVYVNVYRQLGFIRGVISQHNSCPHNKCQNGGRCLDGFHGYECVCSGRFNGQFCEKENKNYNDPNECEMGHHDCHEHATCINTSDGFQCKCDIGFYGNGKTYCLEVNECQIGFHNCHANADCINTDGSFECSCKNGYFGDGNVCDDVNECQDGSHTCHENDLCFNEIGDFKCVQDTDSFKMLIFDPTKGDPVELTWDITTGVETKVNSLLRKPKKSLSTSRFMCSFKLQNRMYLIGGSRMPRNQFIIGERMIRELTPLPFNFDDGRCISVSNSYTLTCAAENHERSCWLFNGSFYRRVGMTSSGHYRGALATVNYNGQDTALIISGLQCGGKNCTGSISTEIFQPGRDHWNRVSEYQEFTKFSLFTAVSMNSQVYLFGGYQGVHKSNNVYVMTDFLWRRSRLNMKFRRVSHHSFSHGNKIFHVGGAGTKLPVECWEFTPGNSTEEVDIAIHQSAETMHYWYPYANSFILPEENDHVKEVKNLNHE